MSLNGLDTPELTEAFAKACAEPGSWYVNCFSSFFSIYILLNPGLIMVNHSLEGENAFRWNPSTALLLTGIVLTL